MEHERDNGERGLTTIGNASFSAADDGVEGEEDTMELSLSVSLAQGWRAAREEAPATCAGCCTSRSSPSSGHHRRPRRRHRHPSLLRPPHRRFRLFAMAAVVRVDLPFPIPSTSPLADRWTAILARCCPPLPLLPAPPRLLLRSVTAA